MDEIAKYIIIKNQQGLGRNLKILNKAKNQLKA